MLPLLLIVSVAFTGFCEGAGVLPAGPLHAAVGGSVIFNTSNIVSKPPYAVVTWTFGVKNILTSTPDIINPSDEYRDRVTYDRSRVSLELRGLTDADDGEYLVQIIAGDASTETGSTNLRVHEPVSNVAVLPLSVDIEELRGPVSLNCSSSGSSLSYVWMKDDSEVPTSDRVQITDGGTRLSISSVMREDDGLYSCRVTNPVSSGSSNLVNISISYGPENTQLTTPDQVNPALVDSNITLTCSAESRPSAEFKWFVNGTLQPEETHQELKLINVKVEQSGTYSCQAFNSKTSKNQTSKPLQITIQEGISNASISVTNLPVEGRSVNLTCEASGSVWTRNWTKGGSDLSLGDNMNLYDNNRVLAFNPVTRSDKGVFVCKVGNPFDNAEASYSMLVNYGPENVVVTVDEPVVVGSDLRLKCSAESVPPANFTWLFNGTERPEASDELVLTKINQSASGNYTCKATNQITGKTSSAEKLVSVQVVLPTEPPDNNDAVIAGSVIGVLAVIGSAGGLGYYFYRKRGNTRKSVNTSTQPGGAGGNAANTSDVNYADISSFQRKNGEMVRLGPKEPATLYADVRVNNNPPAASSSPPDYEAHMERQRTASGPTYAQVQKRQ